MRALAWICGLALALAACGKSRTQPAPHREELEEPLPIVLADGAAVRKGPSGSTLWTHPMAGRLGTVRPPDAVVAESVAVVAVDQQLVALDDATGKERWRAEGPNERLSASDGLVFATDCSILYYPAKRWVVARRLTDGAEAFRVEVPITFSPGAIRHVGDRMLVTRDAPMGDRLTVVFDAHDGNGKLVLDETIITAQVIGADLLFASSERIARIRLSDGSTIWSRPPPASHRGIPAGDIVAVPGGDVLLVDYDVISDSGVEVIRLHPHDGVEVYRAQCAPALVDHSEYIHRAKVRLVDDRISVHSAGSSATIDQDLDLATGKTLRRSVEKF